MNLINQNWSDSIHTNEYQNRYSTAVLGESKILMNESSENN